jgi:ABC-type Fe3+ transport system permease subunit
VTQPRTGTTVVIFLVAAAVTFVIWLARGVIRDRQHATRRRRYPSQARRSQPKGHPMIIVCFATAAATCLAGWLIGGIRERWHAARQRHNQPIENKPEGHLTHDHQ